MNKRLRKIYSLIDFNDHSGIIDVGTDHGMIPVWLAESGYAGRIVASDINPDPLAAAKRLSEEYGVSDRIEFSLSNGLQGCPKDIGTVIIAGMGGDNICAILDATEWCCSPRHTFILQPMTKSEVLRFWLINNGFEITGEYIEKESRRLFSIIKTIFTGQNSFYDDARLFCGKCGPETDVALYSELVKREIARMSKKAKGLVSSEDRPLAAFCTDILNQMKNLEAYYDKSR